MKNDVLIGWGAILLGILSLWLTIKYESNDSPWKLKTRGYIGAIGLFVAGLMYLSHC